MVAAVQIGFYGKLPDRADFVVRGLPESFLNPFGEWVERCLAAGRAALGARWSDSYLTSPVWHFALPAGLAGRQPVLGAMAPSADRAGREFPFIVAACADSDLPATALATAAATWVDLAAELAAAAVTRGLDPSQIQAQVAALGRAWPELPPAARVIAEEGAWRVASPGGLAAGLPYLFDHGAAALGRPSLWWSEGSARVDPGLSVCAALPDPRHFPAMIDGRWKGRPS